MSFMFLFMIIIRAFRKIKIWKCNRFLDSGGVFQTKSDQKFASSQNCIQFNNLKARQKRLMKVSVDGKAGHIDYSCPDQIDH